MTSSPTTQIHFLASTGLSTKPANLSPRTATVFFGQLLTKKNRLVLIASTAITTTACPRFPVSTKAKANATGEQKWTHESCVTESLPNGMFRVRLDNADAIIGYISGKISNRFLRILPGDRVKVEVSLYDSSRGRIVYRLRNRDPTNERLVVLVIGGGGREHALCYALQRSRSCDAVFCAPGNAGISSSGNATCIPDLDISDSLAVISFCRKWGVGLVVVGPEAPLVSGLANELVKAQIPTFGPSAEAAALEGSKNFMKNLCDKYAIPTAKYQTFTDPSSAKQYIQDQGAPIVIKADGLAAGKGVIVAMTVEEAYEAVDSMLVKNVFGSAGCRVVVEEFLEGEEASFFALVDGENAIPLESAQDHKRVGDGDTGPNTGGMGAYSPAPILTKELQSLVMETIILRTVKGMAAEGCKFVGVLYAGLMIERKSGLPKLIEYNVRFGDPECQVLMVRLESDLAQVLLAASRGELSGVSLKWSPGSAMVVVMASKGYPGSYENGSVIRNLGEAEIAAPTVKIFHAGTALDSDGNFIATGGRVLGVTATGSDIEEARDRAYQAVDAINWSGGFCRRDIGWRALPHKQIAAQVYDTKL